MEIPANLNYYCPFCSFKSTQQSKLQLHLRNHTHEKPFFCNECNREFSTNYSLKSHMQSHRGLPAVVPPKAHKETFKCSLCPYITPRKACLATHITRRHTGERSFPCQYPNCEYAAKSAPDLHTHNIRRHGNKRKFKCQFLNCGYRGKNMTDMRRHSVVHSESRPFICDFQGCNHRSKTTGYLKAHKLVVHTNGENKPFACHACNYRAFTKYRLKEHQLTHTEKKPVKCTFKDCSYSCKTAANLKHHALRHHTEKTLTCDFTGCSFRTADGAKLKRHQKNVHYEKVHKCPSCDYRAAYPAHVRRHIGRRHSSQQIIPCPNKDCTFQARHYESLNRHMKLKEGNNVGCPVQGCGFVGCTKSGCKRHIRVHDSIYRPFHCPLCPKQFSKNRILTHHLKSHTDEKPFKCPVCDFASGSKENV